ncbi:MAG: hypothetical protein CMC82_01075 [Flavobacteriaceae bacterium]|nr:hypothetical protein [Flavobacteriaceae bacterium]
MPIYNYKCVECDEISTFMHAYGEVQKDCEKCDTKDSLVKLMSKPTILKTKSKTAGEDSEVGNLTKQFIEENREVLNKQKEEYSKKQYDKS